MLNLCLNINKSQSIYAYKRYAQQIMVIVKRFNMAEASDMTINDVNIDTYTKSVDKEQSLQFILSTTEEQKAKKRGTCKNDILTLQRKFQ